MGFVRKVGLTLSLTFVSTDPPSARRCEVFSRQIIEAENLAQSIFYILAVALSASLAGMLTVWALHTSFALSCMCEYLQHLLFYETDSLVRHCQSGGHRFLCMSRNSSSTTYLAVRH